MSKVMVNRRVGKIPEDRPMSTLSVTSTGRRWVVRTRIILAISLPSVVKESRDCIHVHVCALSTVTTINLCAKKRTCLNVRYNWIWRRAYWSHFFHTPWTSSRNVRGPWTAGRTWVQAHLWPSACALVSFCVFANVAWCWLVPGNAI